MAALRYQHLLLIGGLLLVLLGAVGTINIQGSGFAVTNAYIRGGLGLLGGAAIVYSLVLEHRSQVKSIDRTTLAEDQPSNSPSGPQKTAPSSFFYDYDDDRAETFSKMANDAQCLWVLARTGVNLLNNNEKSIDDILRNGCDVHLLFTDPSSDATRNLYGGDKAIYWHNIKSTARHVGALRKKYPNKFHVRIMPYAPTMSMVMVQNRDHQRDFIRAVFYFIHNAYGNDRPMFKVSRGDRWFHIFRGEFEQLWSTASLWDEHLLDKCPVKM